MSLVRLSGRALRVQSRGAVRYLTTSLPRLAPTPSTPVSSSTTATQPHLKLPEQYHPEKTSIFTPLDTFLPRHLGPRAKDVEEMLSTLGYKTLEDFVDETIPQNVRVKELSDREDEGGLRPLSELELRRRAEEVASMNKGMKSYIGMG
jgi:glycine dehydrogenase